MSLKSFTRQYIETALWSTNDNADDSGGEPLDKNYTAGDITPETRAAMERDCERFYTRNAALWSDQYTGRGEGDEDENAGHDFWLSRNGHGAGFFDGDWGPVSDRLQEAAEAFGTFDLYVGDDGEIHGEIHGSPLAQRPGVSGLGGGLGASLKARWNALWRG